MRCIFSWKFIHLIGATVIVGVLGYVAMVFFLSPKSTQPIILSDAQALDAFSLTPTQIASSTTSLTTSFLLRTNVEVDRKQLKQFFHVEPEVLFRMEKRTDEQAWFLTSLQELLPGTIYRFRLDTMVRDEDGLAQFRTFTWAWKTDGRNDRGRSDSARNDVRMTIDRQQEKSVMLEAVVPSTILMGDKPILKLRALGSAFVRPTSVTYVVDGASVGLVHQQVTGTSMGPTYVSLGQLPSGEHSLKIKLSSSFGDDETMRTIHVLASHREHDAWGSLKEENDAGTTRREGLSSEIILTSPQQEQFFRKIFAFSSQLPMRPEDKVAKRLMQTLFDRLYVQKTAINDQLSTIQDRPSELTRWQAMAYDQSLPWQERLLFARRLMDEGDGERVKPILEKFLAFASGGETLLRLDVSKEKGDNDIATIEVASLASQLGHPKARALRAYVESMWSLGAFPSLGKARYLLAVAPLFSVDGESRIRMRLSRELDIMKTETQEFSVRRSYQASQSLDQLMEGDHVRVHLFIRWRDEALEGCYRLRDFFPGGWKFDRALSSMEESEIGRIGFVESVEGEARFIACKPKNFDLLQEEATSYIAEVVSRGSYKAEALTMQHEDEVTASVFGEDRVFVMK